MRLTVKIPDGYTLSDRFCFACGKIGTEHAGLLICYRHPEGLIHWSMYQNKNTRLNDAIVYRGYVVKATDHSKRSEAHP